MRTAEIERKTLETEVLVRIDLDGTGSGTISTGIAFFDHMLDQVARHGLIDLTVRATGDLAVDFHHTVEDVGIAFGAAIYAALHDKSGIFRYGSAYVPLDESLARVVIDISGRSGLVFAAPFSRAFVGTFDTDLVREFFQALSNHAAITIHVDLIRGTNAHHEVEAIFKAFGRALRSAIEQDPRRAGSSPSTKGML